MFDKIQCRCVDLQLSGNSAHSTLRSIYLGHPGSGVDTPISPAGEPIMKFAEEVSFVFCIHVGI